MHETHIAFYLHLQKLGETTDDDEIKRKKNKKRKPRLEIVAGDLCASPAFCLPSKRSGEREAGRRMPAITAHFVAFG